QVPRGRRQKPKNGSPVAATFPANSLLKAHAWHRTGCWGWDRVALAKHRRCDAAIVAGDGSPHVQARAGEAMMQGGHTWSATGISEQRQWYARPRRWRIHWRSSSPLTTTGSRERTHKRL